MTQCIVINKDLPGNGPSVTLLSRHVKGGVVSLFHVMFKELCHAFSVVRYYVLKGLAFYPIGFTSFLTSWLYGVQSSRKLYLDVRKHCHWSR